MYMIENLIILIIYFSIIFAIGFYAKSRTHTVSDYVLGNRHFGAFVTAMGAGASDMGGWLLMGLPGAVYSYGLSVLWMPLGLIIGAYCNWFFVAKRLRFYSELRQNALTIPEYLGRRFYTNDYYLRVVMAGTILVFFTVYVAAGFVAGGLLFSSIFGLTYSASLILIVVILVCYVVLGGYLAINWVDTFQGSLMFFALLLMPFIAYMHITHPAIATAHQVSLNYHVMKHYILLVPYISIISLLGWGLGYFGQPHILVRFMSSKKVAVLTRARTICIVWMILCLFGAVGTGYTGAFIFHHPTLAKPEEVFLIMAKLLFHPILYSILFSAVLSAILSSCSAQLLTLSAAVSEDLYGIFRPNAQNDHVLLINRLSVVVVALVAWYMAHNAHQTVLNLVGYAWAGLGASFGPAIICSLYYKRMSYQSSLLSVVMGALTVVVWKFLAPLGGIFTLYEIIPGFLVALASIFIGSKIWPVGHLRRIESDFELMDRCI